MTMPDNFKHHIIQPTKIAFRSISDVKVAENGSAYYWFELEEMDFGYVAARTMWTKQLKSGDVIWDRESPEDLRAMVSSEEGLEIMRQHIRFAIIDPSEHQDRHDPIDWIIPPAVIWFLDETLRQAIARSKRPRDSDSIHQKARLVNTINKRPGPFD